MSIHGNWITATLDYDITETGEFAGFDNAAWTELIDLDRTYDKVTVIIPTLGSATTTVCGVPEDGTALKTNIPLPIYTVNKAATGSYLQATSDATTTCIVAFNIYGFRYIRIQLSAAQTSNRVFYCKGIKL